MEKGKILKMYLTPFSQRENPIETDQFIKLGFQYYISARFAGMVGFIPVSGNLYHHAIENLLKSEVETKIRHNLVALWDYFKKNRDSSLSIFDPLIKKLNDWEEIRYPKCQQTQVTMTVGRWRLAPGYDRKPDFKILNVPTKEYQLSVEEMDEFVKSLWLLALKLDPGYFKMMLFIKEAKILYEEDNRNIIYFN